MTSRADRRNGIRFFPCRFSAVFLNPVRLGTASFIFFRIFLVLRRTAGGVPALLLFFSGLTAAVRSERF